MCLSVHLNFRFCFPYSLVSLTCPNNTAQSASEVITCENWESWAACVLLDPLVKLIKESITSEDVHPQGLERKHPDPSFTWEYNSEKRNIFQLLLTEAQFWEVTIKDEAENYNWVFGIDKLYCLLIFFFYFKFPVKGHWIQRQSLNLLKGKLQSCSMQLYICLFVFHTLLSSSNKQTKWNSV